MVQLLQAQAAVNALATATANTFLGQIAGHAFSDHMSKQAASAAAVEQNVIKGYFEAVNKHTIQNVQQFQALSAKNKGKVYANYAGKKPSQLGRHVIHKSFTKTDAMTTNDMARLILTCIGNDAAEYRDGGVAGRFLHFSEVETVLYPDFVARSIDQHGTKSGGGGIGTSGLQWAVLVITAQGTNSVVISAYPSTDAYRLGRTALS